MARPTNIVNAKITSKSLSRFGLDLNISLNILKNRTIKLFVDIDPILLGEIKRQKLVDKLIEKFRFIEAVKEVEFISDVFLIFFNNDVDTDRANYFAWQVKEVLQIFCVDSFDYSYEEGNDSYGGLERNRELEFLYAVYERNHSDDIMKKLLPRQFQSFTAFTKFLADNMEVDENGDVVYNIIKVYYKWNDDMEIYSQNFSIGSRDDSDSNPKKYPNIWASTKLNTLSYSIMNSYYDENDKKKVGALDELYSKFGEERWEMQGNEPYDTLIKLLEREGYYNNKYDFEKRLERFKEYFPKLYNLFLKGSKESKSIRLEKAIKGLQYLADSGDMKAAKAIKGLQYLLNQS